MAASEEPQFFLVSARKSRESGHWDEDDYDVRQGSPDGPDVGRIYKGSVPLETPWFWGINLGPIEPHYAADHGHAESREAAMAAFKVRWMARPWPSKGEP